MNLFRDFKRFSCQVVRGRWRAVDIDTRKVRRRAGRKTGAPPPGMAAAAAASSGGGGARTHHAFPLHPQQQMQQHHSHPQHPIHIPLSAMGFSDNHISVAIRTLREYLALVLDIS